MNVVVVVVIVVVVLVVVVVVRDARKLKFLGATSPERRKFVHRRLIFLGCQYRTCFFCHHSGA